MLHVVLGKIPCLTVLCFVADDVVLLPVPSAASADGRHGRVFTSGSQQPPTLTDFRLATQRMRTQCRHFQRLLPLWTNSGQYQNIYRLLPSTNSSATILW